MYTQQTPDYTKTISPPYLEVEFLLDSGATLNVLNLNEIKEYYKLQLQASIFVLSAANISTLQSNGLKNLTLYPDVTESRTLRNSSITLTFHVSNTNFKILGTTFLERYVDSIKYSSHTHSRSKIKMIQTH